MHHRWTTAALFLGHRRTLARLVPSHMLPELFEVVRRCRIGKPGLELRGQCFVHGVHAGELGAAQRYAVAARDAYAIQHVHKAHHVAVRHVGMPVLSGVRRADVLAALLQVRQRADMRVIVLCGTRSLNFAESLRESAQVAQIQLLIGKPQHAILAESQQDPGEMRLVGLLHVDATNGCAQHCASRFDGQHAYSPWWDASRQCTSRLVTWPARRTAPMSNSPRSGSTTKPLRAAQ